MMDPEEIKSVLSFTASVSTILQFLSGILICQKIVNKGSTGEISSFPFISGTLSTALWLRYGFLIHETSMILVNTVGATLFFAYVVVFYFYSIKKSIVLKQFIACLIIFIVGLSYSQYRSDPREEKHFMGLLCCSVTILFFASPLISLMHVIRAKSSESLPFPIIISTFVVSIQWFLFGVILDDKFVQIPNFLGCVLSAFQLSLFYFYPRKNKLMEDV